MKIQKSQKYIPAFFIAKIYVFFIARIELYVSQVQQRQHAAIYPTVYHLRHMLQQS